MGTYGLLNALNDFPSQFEVQQVDGAGSQTEGPSQDSSWYVWNRYNFTIIFTVFYFFFFK